MATKLMITDPAKAKAYFEAKMAFTTGPVELERMMQQGEAINVVDVRAAEDYAEGRIPGAIWRAASACGRRGSSTSRNKCRGWL